MAAAMRGGSPSRARGRARPKIAQPPRRPAKPAKSRPYAPAKLAAAQSLGLAPLTAVSLAALIAVIGVAAALAADPHVQKMRELAPHHPEERSDEDCPPRAGNSVRSPIMSTQKKRQGHRPCHFRRTPCEDESLTQSKNPETPATIPSSYSSPAK